MTDKALSDVTVLDFSHLLQGPFCTQLLADMGANVIKVERPGQGDLFRTHDLQQPLGRRHARARTSSPGTATSARSPST